MSSRVGGDCSFGMSDGLTVDGRLLEAVPDALSEPFDPPHPALRERGGRHGQRVLDV